MTPPRLRSAALWVQTSAASAEGKLQVVSGAISCFPDCLWDLKTGFQREDPGLNPAGLAAPC